jgi:hypothetical protein
MESLFIPMILLGMLVVPGAALFMFARKRKRNRARAVEWIESSLRAFRFGRPLTRELPPGLETWDLKILEELQRHLATPAPFSPFHSGSWLNASLRLANWAQFHETLSLWSQGRTASRDVLIGESWYLARLQLATNEQLETAVRIFGRAFGTRQVLFNHFDNGTILVLARCLDFEEWFTLTRSALRALMERESLRVGELDFAGIHVPPGRRSNPGEVLQALDALAPADLQPARGLLEACVRFADIDACESVVTQSWVQLVSFPVDQVQHLFFVDNAVKQAMQEQVLERSKQVEWGRQALPKRPPKPTSLPKFTPQSVLKDPSVRVPAPISLDRVFERARAKYPRSREE